VLSLDKINSLNGILSNSSNYTLARDHMGLHGTIAYDVDMSVIMAGSGMELINQSSWPVPSTYNVESIERVVMVDTGKEMFIDSGKDQSSSGPIFTVNITDRPPVITKNLTIRIFNASGTIIDIKPSQDGVNFPGLLSYDTDYVFIVNGVPSTHNNIPINTGDIVEVVVKPVALNTYPIKYIRVYGTGSVLPDSTTGISFNYYHDPKYPQKSVCYPATMKLEVWSYALA